MHLIPYATHAKAVVLIEAAAGYTGTAVVQSAAPSAARTVLCTTPPVPAEANAAVGPIVVAVTAREACESAFVRGLLVG